MRSTTLSSFAGSRKRCGSHDPDHPSRNLDVRLCARHRDDAHQGNGNVDDRPPVLNGHQNKKDKLDYYYALYETDFIEEESIEFTFDKVCNELVQVLPEIKKTRWSHLIDFYSLFTVLAEVQDSLPLAQDGREALHEKLLAFGNGITSYQRKSDDDKKSDNTNIVLYASGIRNSSDLNARKNRYSALKSTHFRE